MRNFTPTHHQLNITVRANDPTQRIWLLLLSLVPVVIAFGNSFVILGFLLDRRLRRNLTNHFIFSLAVFDLLVALVVSPFTIYLTVISNQYSGWYCSFHLAFNVFLTTGSILNLLLISIDRYVAITHPTDYQRLAKRIRSRWPILLVVLLSVVTAAPAGMERNSTGICWLTSPEYLMLSALLSFFVPATTFVVIYGRIFLQIQVRSKLLIRQKSSLDDHEDGVGPHPVCSSPLPTLIVDSPVDKDRLSRNSSIVSVNSRRISTGSESHSTTTASNYMLSPPTLGVSSRQQQSSNSPSTSKRNSIETDMSSSPVSSRSGSCASACQISSPTGNSTFSRLQDWLNETESAGNHNDNNNGGRGAPQIRFSATDEIRSFSWSNPSPMPSSMGRKLRSITRQVRSGRRKKRRAASTLRRETRATRLVAAIVVVFVICWLPFFLLAFVRSVQLRYDPKLLHLSEELMKKLYLTALWFGYTHSAMGPILYTSVNREFRMAFRKILTLPSACRRQTN